MSTSTPDTRSGRRAARQRGGPPRGRARRTAASLRGIPMTPELVFSLAGLLARAGWAALLLSPLMPVWSDRIAGRAIPAGLSFGYVAVIAASPAPSGGLAASPVSPRSSRTPARCWRDGSTSSPSTCWWAHGSAGRRGATACPSGRSRRACPSTSSSAPPASCCSWSCGPSAGRCRPGGPDAGGAAGTAAAASRPGAGGPRPARVRGHPVRERSDRPACRTAPGPAATAWIAHFRGQPVAPRRRPGTPGGGSGGPILPRRAGALAGTGVA